MEFLIKDLIAKLSIRKNNEMAYYTKYKNEEQLELMHISSAKIIELDHIISELKVLLNNKSHRNNYYK